MKHLLKYGADVSPFDETTLRCILDELDIPYKPSDTKATLRRRLIIRAVDEARKNDNLPTDFREPDFQPEKSTQARLEFVLTLHGIDFRGAKTKSVTVELFNANKAAILASYNADTTTSQSVNQEELTPPHNIETPGARSDGAPPASASRPTSTGDADTPTHPTNHASEPALTRNQPTAAASRSIARPHTIANPEVQIAVQTPLPMVVSRQNEQRSLPDAPKREILVNDKGVIQDGVRRKTRRGWCSTCCILTFVVPCCWLAFYTGWLVCRGGKAARERGV